MLPRYADVGVDGICRASAVNGPLNDKDVYGRYSPPALNIRNGATQNA